MPKMYIPKYACQLTPMTKFPCQNVNVKVREKKHGSTHIRKTFRGRLILLWALN